MLNHAIDTAFGANCELVKMPVTVAIEIEELLREQEPVKPIKREDLLFCGGCKTAIHNFLNYCPRCGRKVDWNA